MAAPSGVGVGGMGVGNGSLPPGSTLMHASNVIIRIKIDAEKILERLGLFIVYTSLSWRNGIEKTLKFNQCFVIDIFVSQQRDDIGDGSVLEDIVHAV